MYTEQVSLFNVFVILMNVQEKLVLLIMYRENVGPLSEMLWLQEKVKVLPLYMYLNGWDGDTCDNIENLSLGLWLLALLGSALAEVCQLQPELLLLVSALARLWLRFVNTKMFPFHECHSRKQAQLSSDKPQGGLVGEEWDVKKFTFLALL